MLSWLITFCALYWSMVQGGRDILIEDVACTDVNEEYIKTCSVELNEDSTYGTSLNTCFEIVKTVPTVRVLFNMFTVEMGEYTVDIGVNVDSDYCEVLQGKNSIGIPILRAINMDSDNCPPKPGTYQKEGFVLDSTDGLPSTFPNGHYLMNITFLCENTALMHLDVYIAVF